MDINHLKLKFIEEAEAMLTNLDNVLIELEKNPKNNTLNAEVFRVLHTIKGSGGMFGFEFLVEITHELETLYDMVRNNEIEINSELLDLSFATADHLRALILDEALDKNENKRNHANLKERVEKVKAKYNNNNILESKNIEATPLNSSAKNETWQILFYPNDEIVKRAINLVYTFHDLLCLGEYKIHNIPSFGDKNQFWSIFLITDKGYNAIEDALIFVMDYCKITKITDFDIFEPNVFEKRDKIISSINDLSPNENQEMSVIKQEKKPIQPEQMRTISENVEKTDKETIIPTIAKHKTNHVQVEATKLDTLMYLVSELVTTKSELINGLIKENQERVMNASEKIDKLTKLFSENALNLRLVSIHAMTERFKRLVRDLAKQLGKNINFITTGDNTELDKSIIDHIGEPVMHIIRNCVDHGIENPEDRKKKGKEETGTVKFETIKSGNHVYILISDDGKGLDPEYILKKAIEKGFVNAGTVLSEKEIFDLIFIPGFSTAESITNVSGRGVGMDIVLKSIQDIRGEVSVSSSKNNGTVFTIKLQQTISIIDTLLIQASGVTYAVPVGDIDSCILEAHENLIDRQNQLFNFNGDLIPFMFIEKIEEKGEPTQDRTDKMVVIKKNEKLFAIVVENIIGEYQAVIKPLGHAFHTVKFLSGASLLGDGSIALLIDTDKLWCHSSEIF